MEVYCEMEDYKLIDEHSRPAADRKERQEHHNMRETRFWAVAVFIMAFVFLLTAASMASEMPKDPKKETADIRLDPGETEETEGISPEDPGDSQGESGNSEGGSDGESEDREGLLLTEESFQVGDVPEGFLEPVAQQGTIERVRYQKEDENGEKETKSVIVYLPVGYAESDRQYNVLYLLHASGGSPRDYLDPGRVTPFQCLIDHMIEEGKLEPLIIAAPTYTSGDPFESFLPLGIQVTNISDFPDELTEYIIPAVEETFYTYAESVDEAGIRASRDHRAVAGFSLGGTAAWNVFIQKMSAFRWFLPISEASWDDGEGGINGIWDSDLSAEVLYEAVGQQGYTADDFILFVATGTEDIAFEIATEQMKSLLEYTDMFITGENTSCSMMIGGTHTLSAIYTYMYHIMPALFY